MADTSISIKNAQGELVAVDTRTAANGDERQVFLIGDGENEELVNPATEETLEAVALSLQSGEDPLTGLDKGGLDVDGTEQVLVPANAARVKVAGQNATDGRVWLGYGEPPVVGDGLFVESGGYFEEFTQDEVQVLAEPAVTGRVTWQEWGA